MAPPPNAAVDELLWSFRSYEALQRLQSHPNEARVISERYPGKSPLYLACRDSNVPILLIKTLVDAWPQGVTYPSHTGWTPLHMAAIFSSDIRVLKLLVDASPEALFVRDDPYGGSTPLLCLVYRHESLLRKPLKMSFCKNATSCAQSFSMFIAKCCFKNVINCKNVKCATNCAQSFNMFIAKCSFLVKAMANVRLSCERYLEAECEQETNADTTRMESQQTNMLSSSASLVHDCINAGMHCPYDLLLYAFQSFSSCVLEPNPEDDGNLPLHSLCSRGNVICMSKILSMCPPKSSYQAARTRNRRGRLPLHILVERLRKQSSSPWEGYDDYWSDANWVFGVEEALEAVSLLIKAYPGALCVKDPSNNLLPFMIAAASGANHGEGAPLCTASVLGQYKSEDFDGVKNLRERIMFMLDKRNGNMAQTTSPCPSFADCSSQVYVDGRLYRKLVTTYELPRSATVTGGIVSHTELLPAEEGLYDAIGLNFIYHVFRQQPDLFALNLQTRTT